MNNKTLIMSMLKDVKNMLESELEETRSVVIGASLNYVNCAINQLEVYERREK